jgi:hypothetical protein
MKQTWKIFFVVIFAATALPALIRPDITPKWVGWIAFFVVVVGGGLTLKYQFKESNARRAKVLEIIKARAGKNPPPPQA